MTAIYCEWPPRESQRVEVRGAPGFSDFFGDVTCVARLAGPLLVVVHDGTENHVVPAACVFLDADAPRRQLAADYRKMKAR